MKVRTFVCQKVEDLDKEINEFEKTHRVRATQTDTITTTKVYHKATLFYEE